MDVYEVPLTMSLLGFGMGTMLANINMCGLILVLKSVFNMFVRNASLLWYWENDIIQKFEDEMSLWNKLFSRLSWYLSHWKGWFVFSDNVIPHVCMRVWIFMFHVAGWGVGDHVVVDHVKLKMDKYHNNKIWYDINWYYNIQ